jgi:diguanylate cyclase (GGDEF)-like protein
LPAIDVHTIAYSTAVITFVMFVALLAYWNGRRTYAGFGWWVASMGLASLTVLVLVTRDAYPVPLLGNLASQVLALIWALVLVIGTLLFFGRSPRDALTWGVVAFGIAAMLAGRMILIPDLVGIALGSVAIGLLMLRAAWVLKDEATPALRSAAQLCAVVLLVYGAVRFWRAGQLLLAPSDYDTLSSNWPAIINHLFNLAFGAVWGFAFLLLNSARVEAELLGSRVEVSRLTSSDSLTGVANRLAFFEAGAQWFARARRGHTPLSVVVIAIDHLRSINTDHGHAIGDGVLTDVAHEVVALSPPSDLVARVSGEEFAVLLPESTAEHARTVAERLCIQIASRAVSPAHLSVTATLGTATRTADDASFEQLFRRAEHALAEAKTAGRNRVAVA